MLTLIDTRDIYDRERAVNNIMDCMISPDDIDTLPIEVISTGLPDIMLPIASVDELERLRPNMEALSQLSQELDVVGVHAFAIAGDDYTAHVRTENKLQGHYL